MAPDPSITIIHSNDFYELDLAPRWVARAKRLQRENGGRCLVLFSGDCFAPSLLSVLTKGRQMTEILKVMGVHAACVGNHDLDHGVPTFLELKEQCKFPWLMANVLERATGEPLAGAVPTLVLDWPGGVRVGLVGLVEEEWMTTLSKVEASDLEYRDFVPEGRRLARELREQGADVVIALTHMRLPNDVRLARNVPEIDLVLGGHDHEYYMLVEETNGTPIIKSGTNFEDLTEIRIRLRPPCDSLPSTIEEGDEEDEEEEEEEDSTAEEKAAAAPPPAEDSAAAAAGGAPAPPLTAASSAAEQPASGVEHSNRVWRTAVDAARRGPPAAGSRCPHASPGRG